MTVRYRARPLMWLLRLHANASAARPKAPLDPIRECLYLWPAYQSIAEYATICCDASAADPRDVYRALTESDADGDQSGASRQDRYAHLLVAHAHAETMREARGLLDELRVMTRDGRRPRFGVEIPGIAAAFAKLR